MTTIVRRIARPMLAAQFIWGGIHTFRDPGPRAETARPLLEKLSGPLHLPDDPELVVRANAAVMAGAGAMLAFGRLPRLAGAVLAVTMVPTTYAGHPFWQEKDPDIRRRHGAATREEPVADLRRALPRLRDHLRGEPADGAGRRPRAVPRRP